ncbi:MAG: hypothetical protein V8R16_03300 [Bacilli bacterium]
MKKYNKPIIKIDNIILEDVILISTNDKTLDWNVNTDVDEEL